MAKLTRAQQNLFIQTCIITQTSKDVCNVLQAIMHAQLEDFYIAVDSAGLSSYFKPAVGNIPILFIRLPKKEMKRFKYFVKYNNHVLKNQ